MNHVHSFRRDRSSLRLSTVSAVLLLLVHAHPDAIAAARLGTVQDGSRATIVADLRPGTLGSGPITGITAFQGRLYLCVDDGVHGREPWEYDPATRQARMLADVRPGGATSHSCNSRFVPLGNRLYFRADDGVHGRELWIYDPASDAVSLVGDLAPGPDSSGPEYLTVLGDRLYFRTYGPDDTALPTMLTSFDPATHQFATFPAARGHMPIAFNDRLYYSSAGNPFSGELWAFDPLSGSTALVADINPLGPSSPRSFEVLDGKLYFAAFVEEIGVELFVYDPVTDNASLAADIGGPAWHSNPSVLTAFDGKLYFSASFEGYGLEPGVYDPATGESRMLADINPGHAFSSPTGFTAFQGRLYFSARSADEGTELFAYDPVTDAVTLVSDINPSTLGHGSPTEFAVLEDRMYFRADDGVFGRELWSYPGDTFRIYASAGAGGRVDPFWYSIVPAGTDQTFTFTPDAGHAVSNVLVDGFSAGRPSRYTFSSVSADHNVWASFAPADGPLSGAYAVGPDGDFSSPAAALAALAERGVSAAVTFNVAEGTYEGPLVLAAVTGATAADTVRFEASGEVTIVSNESPALHLNGASHVRFDGFTFRREESGAGRVLQLDGLLEDVVFRQNRFTRPQGDRVISGENFSGTVHFVQNEIQGGTGVFLSGHSSNRPRLVFERNTVQHLLHLMYLQSPSIRGNRVTGRLIGYWWRGETDAPALVANNVVRASGQAFELIDAVSVHIYHNTIRSSPCTNTSSAAGNVTFISVAELRLMNNIMVCSGPGTNLHTRTVSGFEVSDFNAFHADGPRMASVWLTNPIRLFRSLDELRRDDVWGGRDAHSVSGYVHFDSELRTDAPWIARAGTPLEEVPTDIDGNPRDPLAPSIGAYEFTSTTTLLPTGTYLVGSNGAYPTLAEAALDLARRGAAGPVTFTLGPRRQAVIATIRRTHGIGPESPLTITSSSSLLRPTLHAYDLNFPIIRIDAAAHVRLADLIFDTRDIPDYSLSPLVIGEGADDVEVRNVAFRSPVDPAGLPATIYLDGISHRGVRIIDSRFEGGGYVLGGTGGSAELRAEEFVFARNEVTGAQRGLLIFNASSPRVEANRMHVHNRPLHCVGCTADGEPGIIANNAFRVEAAPALDLHGNHLRLYHNTVHVSACSQQTGVVSLSTPVNPSGFDLRNNVIACETPGRVLTYVHGNELYSDHNHYWSEGASLFATNVEAWATLDEFQTATGHEASSTFEEVSFTSNMDLSLAGVGGDDFRGTPETLAVVPIDLLGESRPDPPRKGAYEEAGAPVSVEDDPGTPLLVFRLEAAFPNPTGGRATIRFVTSEPGRATISLWDILGREVLRVVDADVPAGRHEAVIDGRGLATGTYFVRLSAAGQRATQRLVVAR